MISLSEEWKKRLLMPPPGWRDGSFVNAREQSLPYAISEPAVPGQGVVLFVHGMGESKEKYYEMAADLNKRGLRAGTFDRMGQGRGGRYLPDRHKIHSSPGGFDSDAADLIQFAEDKFPGQKTTMLAHSTGALVALLAYQKRPDLFTEPVLSAPLLGIHDKKVRGREKWIARLRYFLPRAVLEEYVDGGGPWCQRGTKGAKEPDQYCLHPARMWLRDHWHMAHPELQTGDTTMGWLVNACAVIARVNHKSFLQSLGPVTIFTAGKDILVDNSRVDDALKHLRHKRHIHFKEALHELPFEREEYRNVLIDHVIAIARGDQTFTPSNLPSANQPQYNSNHEPQRFTLP